ncbi:DUF58 domain-containing protein [Bacillus sp. HNG]|uniref:DUF58 domain-containing protein n=1 Tax=Bacillus sp. HNG TaxID=2293325 RepID=UPI000E2E9535|nr:DUF58 domain-containing protein [Bacillus sp. HNG]RFB18833.1 DUF58 domain-containing protein [Bacillus sp. HNG]
MTKSLKNLWDRFLFLDRGILPTTRLILALLLLSIGFLVLTSFKLSWEIIIGLNLFILFGSLVDLFFSPRKKNLSAIRKLPPEVERGLTTQIEVEVTNNSTYGLSYRLVDGIPDSFTKSFPIKGKISGETTSRIIYQTEAMDRGDYQINKLYFRYKSLLGLWEKQLTFSIEDHVKVIPNLSESRKYLENAQKFLLYEGVKIRKQQTGTGEFSKIRSYVVGDDPRTINWRQTAKLHEVMTNEYEPEHGKYITILLDCGRMMGAELEKGNRLERAIESAITVATAALQNGDYVSMLAFSTDVKVFVPAGKGITHLQTILQAVYNLKVDAVESNYGAVLSYLETVQKKRSLLLMFSDVQTFVREESALVYLRKLRKRHYFLMIGVEDATLNQRIDEKPTTIQKAMLKSMAQQQMLVKKREKQKWENQGLMMVEAKEDKLAVTAVSYYINIMNRNLL